MISTRHWPKQLSYLLVDAPGFTSRLHGISVGSLCRAMELEGTSKSHRYLPVGRGGKQSMLGRGSYGQVSPAWDTGKERLVAIKVQQRESQSAMREMMFFQCVPHHPNVLRMLDMFVSGSDLSLVFEYCTLSLGDIWKRAQGFLDWNTARRYSLQVLHGIAHLHRNDVSHRDIDMSNVLLREDGDRMVCVVADLGLPA